MSCLNVFFNILFAVLFCEHRCRTSRLNVLDATSVAGTQARLRLHMKTHKKPEPKSQRKTHMKRTWKTQVRSASNQTQNPKFASQRNLCRPQCQTSKRQKSGPGHQWIRQDCLLARLQSDSNRINRSPHPSFLEDNSRGDQLYITVTMWPIKYNASTQTSIFLRCFIEYQNKKFPWRKSFLSSKKATQALSVQ